MLETWLTCWRYFESSESGPSRALSPIQKQSLKCCQTFKNTTCQDSAWLIAVILSRWIRHPNNFKMIGKMNWIWCCAKVLFFDPQQLALFYSWMALINSVLGFSYFDCYFHLSLHGLYTCKWHYLQYVQNIE